TWSTASAPGLPQMWQMSEAARMRWFSARVARLLLRRRGVGAMTQLLQPHPAPSGLLVDDDPDVALEWFACHALSRAMQPEQVAQSRIKFVVGGFTDEHGASRGN